MIHPASQANPLTVSSDPYVFYMSCAPTPLTVAWPKKDISDVALEQFHAQLCSHRMQFQTSLEPCDAELFRDLRNVFEEE
ncbi:hypothetical protein QFZ55_007214 [Streptomyces luteogriseus]|nr:hypothetical protein [Streptomyces luteogriseus]